jgi:hypothetical protein
MITETQAARIIALLETIALNTMPRGAAMPTGGLKPSDLPVDGAVFPPYGKNAKGPIRGATERDLVFYRNGSLRSLADASKSRWHDKERALLNEIELEMRRQKISFEDTPSDAPALDNDSDVPF